jgi:hypothetical protein
LRVVRIDPQTGEQSYVASLSQSVVGSQTDCHLYRGQPAYANGSLYLLVDQTGPGLVYARVVRVAV